MSATLDTVARTASSLHSRSISGIAAILVGCLFAVSVLGFRALARVDAPDLGLSVWAERPATEARITSVLATVLDADPVAAWLGEHVVTRQMVATDSAPPQRWNAIVAIAEAVTSEKARNRLAGRWADRLVTDEDFVRGSVSCHFAALRSPPPGGVDIASLLANHHEQALNTEVRPWLATELSNSKLESILLSNHLHVEAVSSYAPQLHDAIAGYLPHARVGSELRDGIARDLHHYSAQTAIVRAAERDFSGRWIWAVLAAVFLTAGMSAIAGGWLRIRALGATHAGVLAALYCAAVITGALVGWFLSDLGPLYLHQSLQRFSALYNVGLAQARAFLNALALASIAALFVIAWSPFLVATRGDDHLDLQLGTLRWTFHTSTFVLVVSVLQAYALWQWPAAFMADASASLVQNTARMTAIAIGAAFSALLLLIYVPAARVLVEEARARQSPAEPQRTERIERMLARHGFDTSVTQQVVRFVQLFAPLLIAPLAELVGILE
jgi:hypothetical protein